MKKYVLKNKYLEDTYNLVSECYFNTLDEVNDAIDFMCNEWNRTSCLKKQWTKEDFEILECE